MKIVLQRVSSAKVEISNKIKGQISQGYLILLGIGEGDNEEDINWLINKILTKCLDNKRLDCRRFSRWCKTFDRLTITTD